MKDAAAPGPALDLVPLQLCAAQIAVAALPPADVDAPATLPRDHPAWQRDVLAVSARVRAIVARLRPVAIRVLTFWDHAVRSITVGRRRLDIDPSGCYRLR